MGSGSIPWYDGSAFATNGDIVVLTVNYRLRALGFYTLLILEARKNIFEQLWTA